MGKQMAIINGTELRRSRRHSKAPRLSIETDELTRPFCPLERRISSTPPSPTPPPVVSGEILVAPCPDAERGSEASSDDGIDKFHWPARLLHGS
ncbi:hypothetical protein FGADI_5410 [Fusarium gaditjirri]|uniref:Uncharacterized protein n=1 Tax=Fusarium gaditjirri TaxID=282569 RepID=A0A8H4WXM2_9HYPO|nr:hypothetical protein FGADI_5410 [Fusarium gaditjirri]